MYLIIALVAMILGISVSPEGDIWNVPLGQLTIHMIFGKFLALIYYACALVLGLKSLEVDRVWPWHWTRTFVYSVVIRSVMASAFVYGVIVFTAEHQIDVGWRLMTIVLVSAVLLYYVLFSSKFEFFEKPERAIPVEELAEAVVLVEPWFPSEGHKPADQPSKRS